MPILQPSKIVYHHFRPSVRDDGWQDQRGGITVAICRQQDSSVRVGFALCRYDDVFNAKVGERVSRDRVLSGDVKTVTVEAETVSEALDKAVSAVLDSSGHLSDKLQSNLSSNGMSATDLRVDEDVVSVAPYDVLTEIRAQEDCEDHVGKDPDDPYQYDRWILVQSRSLGKAVRITKHFTPLMRGDEQVGETVTQIDYAVEAWEEIS